MMVDVFGLCFVSIIALVAELRNYSVHVVIEFINSLKYSFSVWKVL